MKTFCIIGLFVGYMLIQFLGFSIFEDSVELCKWSPVAKITFNFSSFFLILVFGFFLKNEQVWQKKKNIQPRKHIF